MDDRRPFRTQMTAEELRSCRMRVGATQRELGEFLGHSTRTVQQWEQGRRRIPQGVAAIVTHERFGADYRAARGLRQPASTVPQFELAPPRRGRPRRPALPVAEAQP